MGKMRTLFNVVVLFVLVLFGSVVPASAQEPQASVMTADVWAILGVGFVLLGVLVPLLIHFNSVNHKAHEKIGEKVDNGFTGVNNELKELNRAVGRVEGALGRPSESGQG